MIDRKGLLMFGLMLLAFCVIMAGVMVWVRGQARHVPLDNQISLAGISSSVDSVAVIVRENNQILIQFKLRLEGIPVVLPETAGRRP